MRWWKCWITRALKNVQTSPPERVLRLPPGGKANVPVDPAITVQSVGRGCVVFVSTSANLEWTDMPAQPSSVPLLCELLDWSVRNRGAWMNLTVGDRIAVPRYVDAAFSATLARDGSSVQTVLQKEDGVAAARLPDDFALIYRTIASR